MQWHNGMMGWIIWPSIVFGMMRIFRRGGRRRRDRLKEWGAQRGRWDRAERAEFEAGPDPDTLMLELDAQRAELAEMATRLSELENRADFAERLLSTPREKINRSSLAPGVRGSTD